MDLQSVHEKLVTHPHGTRPLQHRVGIAREAAQGDGAPFGHQMLGKGRFGEVRSEPELGQPAQIIELGD